MAIFIDIFARFREDDLRRQVREVGTQLERDGQSSGERFGSGLARGVQTASPKVQKAMNAIEDATLRTQRAQEKYSEAVYLSGMKSQRAIKASEDLAVARRKEADAHRAAGSALRDFQRDTDRAKLNAKGLNEELQSLGTNAFRSARGLGTGAAVPALLFLGDLAQVAVTASQSLLLLPAAITTVAAGMGTLQLATAGFGDAIKDIRDPEKFAEGLASLAPNAQQAALSIQNLLPEFDKLKAATQDAFFAGIGEEIHNLSNQFLPEIQSLTTGIADSFNQMMRNVSTEFQMPWAQSSIQTLTDNIVATFRNLEPGVTAVARAFLDMAAAGSSFLPNISTEISNAAIQFSNFISQARASGELSQWIRDGIDAVKALGEAIWLAGEIIVEVFGGTGQEGIEGFKDDLQGIREIVGILTGDFSTMGAAWREELDGMTGPAATFRDALMDIPEALNFIGDRFVDFANNVKNSFLNGPIKAFNFGLQTLTKLLNLLPGDDKDVTFGNIAEIPDIQYGGVQTNNWGGWQQPGPANPTHSRDTDTSRNALNGPKQWTDPNTGKVLTLVPGIGWLPADDPRAQGQTAGLGNYPGMFNVPPPPPPGESGGKPKISIPHDQVALDKIGIGGFQGLGPQGVAGLQPNFSGMDPQDIWDAQSRIQSSQIRVEETRTRVLELQADNTTTEQDLLKAKNNVTEAERDYISSIMDVNEKAAKQFGSLSDGLGEIGAALDKDLGISKGLPGIADNLVRFLASLAFAPMMGKLAAIQEANPYKGGHGLIGIAAAQGAFGDQFRGLDSGGNGTGGSNISSQSTATGGVAAGLQNLYQGMAPTDGNGTGSSNISSPYSSIMAPSQTPLAGPTPGGSYGLPGNTNTGGYGTGTAEDFPPWVMAMADAFKVSPSTYPGHQDTNRNEAGYAANPGMLNRGIDWSGTPENMQRFADYLARVAPGAPGLEQIIWENPQTGQRTGLGGAGNPTTGYYPDTGEGSYAEHRDHVHTRQSSPIPVPATGSGGWGSGGARTPGLLPEGLSGGGGESPIFGFPQSPAPSVPGVGGSLGSNPAVHGTGAMPGPTPIGAQIASPGVAMGGKGGVGASDSLMALATTAASALDVMAPGAGQAAAIGMKLANRAIQYGGQLAGIGVSGLMETFLPTGGSELANGGWLPRIVGGLAGATPALPNVAGKDTQKALTPEQAKQGQAGAPGSGNNIDVTYNSVNQTEDQNGRALADQLGRIPVGAGIN